MAEPASNRTDPGQARLQVRRREAIETLLSAAAGLTLAPSGLIARQAVPAPIVRTLLKDVPPSAIAGATLFHEHLSMRFPLGASSHFTDDVALMVEEARAAVTDGIGCLVDGGHDDMRRDLSALRRIAAESGLLVVASGGYYMQRTYPADLAWAAKSADDIARDLAAEAARERYGAFGEIGQQGGTMTPDERKVFEAVAKAQAVTGLPIFTHNAYLGTRPGAADIPRDTALRQLDVLLAAGAVPAHLAIGHVCCLDDPTAEIASALAKRGVYVGFDRVTLQLLPDAQKVTTIMALVEAGHADKLLLSSDFSNARGLKKNGGAGLAQAVTVFGPMLIKAGLREDLLRQIFVDNPRRFLAFVPKG